MKTRSILLALMGSLMLTLLMPAAARAQYVNGQWLNIGGNSFGADGMYSGGVGWHNYLGKNHSLAVGMYNSVDGWYAGVFGYNNVAGGSGASSFSLVSGRDNVVQSTQWCLVSGSGNQVGGSTTGPGGFLTVGNGLVNDAPNTIVLGTYNKGGYSSMSAEQRPLFVVGTGTASASSSRRDSLRVYPNGDVVISKAQGDVSMGVFTSSPYPSGH